MNRRDFAKGLAALPFASAVPSFASICNSTCKSDPHFFWVVLQGPFAVVANNNDGSIRAFTPKDSGHMFAFNGVPADKDTVYHFQLQLSGRPSPPPIPCVQNQFPRFCAENIRFDFSNTQDDFITIDLPGPDRIIIGNSSYQADMQDGTTSLPVPGDHILEYDVAPNAITMTASFDNTTVTVDATSDLAFIFEIGLAKSLGGGDSDPNGTHARTFYNDHLLARFLDLTGKSERMIKQISLLPSANSQKQVTLAQPRKLAPKQQSARPGRHSQVQQPERMQPFVTTYECKAGGLLVSSP